MQVRHGFRGPRPPARALSLLLLPPAEREREGGRESVCVFERERYLQVRESELMCVCEREMPPIPLLRVMPFAC